ncbi:MAG: hypothetical protein M5R36_00390 [Deltaproteobacteria bacterium]|nr:hypothetical protein [Deltaproteobacteria bacterium]
MTYEGQAAIRLEAEARRAGRRGFADPLPYALVERDGLLLVDWAPLFRWLCEDKIDAGRADIAWAFHDAVARAGADLSRHAADKTDVRDIVLSGGVFMNRLLVELIHPRLTALGFTVRTHALVPTNDGGIALGQVLCAGSA